MNLTRNKIESLTYPAYYDRGLDYYTRRKVIEYEEIDGLIKAKVSGTRDYSVRVDLNILEFNCNCPAFRNVPCKHIIAVLLAKLHGFKKPKKKKDTPKSRKKQNSVKKNEKVDELLEKKSKVELVQMCKDLSETNPVVEKFIKRNVKGSSNIDYKYVKQKVKSLFRNVRYLGGDWWGYVNKLDNIHDEALLEVSSLPVDKESAEFLLEMTDWIHEKQLTRLDDSDGIIGDLAYQMLTQACKYFEQKDADLTIIYKYTSKDSSFGLNLEIVSFILREVKNDEIKKQLAEKIEKTMFKKDPDFNFEEDYVYSSLLQYLREVDCKKFEDLALELYKDDYSILELLVKELINQKRYKEALEYVWKDRHHHFFEKYVILLLKKLKEWKKLIGFYTEKIDSHFSIDTLRELKKLIKKHQGTSEWNQFITKLKNKSIGYYAELELSLFTKDYENLYKELTSRKEKEFESYISNSEIENYANKLLLLHEPTALKLYKYLVELELEKIEGGSSHYDRLFEYLKIIRKLQDKPFINKLKRSVNNNFPTKKKLIERITNF